MTYAVETLLHQEVRDKGLLSLAFRTALCCTVYVMGEPWLQNGHTRRSVSD